MYCITSNQWTSGIQFNERLCARIWMISDSKWLHLYLWLLQDESSRSCKLSDSGPIMEKMHHPFQQTSIKIWLCDSFFVCYFFLFYSTWAWLAIMVQIHDVHTCTCILIQKRTCVQNHWNLTKRNETEQKKLLTLSLINQQCASST